jgi:hypothetical protein
VLLISTDVAVLTVMSSRQNKTTHTHCLSTGTKARKRRKWSEYLGSLIDGRITKIEVYITLEASGMGAHNKALMSAEVAFNLKLNVKS